MRVRHFCFLANQCRAQRRGQIRTALEAPDPAPAELPEHTGTFDDYPCPKCRYGRLH